MCPCLVEVPGGLFFSEGRRRGVDLEQRGDLGREPIGSEGRGNCGWDAIYQGLLLLLLIIKIE